MLGYACLVVAVVICAIAIFKPIIGTFGFYFFAFLDPIWNWRWILSTDLGLQKWLFFSTLIGVVLQWGTLSKTSKLGRRCILALIVFSCIALISSRLTSFPDESLWYIGFLFRVFAMAVLAILTVTDHRRAFWLGFACVLGQGYNSLEINREYFQLGYCRYAAMADWGYKGLDNNGYSILTVPILAIALSIALCHGNLMLRAVAGLIGVLEMHQLMLMQSRGSMVGAVLFGVLAVFFIPKTKQSIALIVSGLIVVGALAGPPVMQEFMSSFAEKEQRDSSAESRFYLWKAGFKLILDHPLTGVGPNASRYYVPRYYEGDLNTSAKALHNLFFEVGSENGIPGVFIFLMFYALPWLYVYRHRQLLLRTGQVWTTPLSLAVLAGIPGYLLASMFSSGSLIESSYILSIIACGLASTCEIENQIDEPQVSGETDESRDASQDSSVEITPEPLYLY